MRIAIAGAGAVGRSIAGELLENGHEVLLIDHSPQAIKVDTVPEEEDGARHAANRRDGRVPRPEGPGRPVLRPGRLARPPGGGRSGRDVGGERGQLSVGPRGECLACPRAKLVFGQAACHERSLQQVDDVLAVDVGGPELAPARRRPVLRSHDHQYLPRRHNAKKA